MKTYKPAVDSWLALIMIGTPLIIIGAGLSRIKEAQVESLWLTGIGILVGIFIGLLAIPCRYTVSESHLEIRCGFIKEKIQLNRIEKLTFSSNMLSAPALSLKRVRIDLNDGYRLISPKNREAFINHIESLKA